MTKYTPGPWFYDIEADTVFANDGRYGERTAICKVDDQPEYEEHQANACLIAAAPELLAVLEEMMADTVITQYCQAPTYKGMFACARAAIAKAKGAL